MEQDCNQFDAFTCYVLTTEVFVGWQWQLEKRNLRREGNALPRVLWRCCWLGRWWRQQLATMDWSTSRLISEAIPEAWNGKGIAVLKTSQGLEPKIHVGERTFNLACVLLGGSCILDGSVDLCGRELGIAKVSLRLADALQVMVGKGSQGSYGTPETYKADEGKK